MVDTLVKCPMLLSEDPMETRNTIKCFLLNIFYKKLQEDECI